MAESLALNMDCMAYMRTLPDKTFDLAVVDPPYGDGRGAFSSGSRFGGIFDRYTRSDPDGRELVGEVRKKL